jgi:hypothetical protein
MDSEDDIEVPFSQVPIWKPGKRPERIYHYTNAPGLMGIFNSKTLWATDVWYMNDTGEATYAKEVIRQFLDSRTPESENMRQVCSLTKRIIRRGWREDKAQYIACLSENGDQLSQWRSYGSGRGFSIGFDLEAMLQLFSGPKATGSVGKVIYDRSLQQSLLTEIYQQSEEVLSSLLDDEEAQTDLKPHGLNPVSVAATGILARSMILADFFKHPAFNEEAEVRIHASRTFSDGKPPADVKFRETALGITPYVAIPICPPGTDTISVVREVIIGPQSHQREVQRAIGQFFAASGLTDVEVRLSRVPLRA